MDVQFGLVRMKWVLDRLNIAAPIMKSKGGIGTATFSTAGPTK